jgi:hypothetical protein
VEGLAATRYILLRLPTRTHKGYMSPMECVPGGSVPSLRRLRVWGCKAYMSWFLQVRGAKIVGRTKLGLDILSVTPRIKLVGLSIYQIKKRR